MAFTIAVAGKGGVGKTTVAGLIVRELVERGDGPVLAIDADPNTNFHQVLGLTVERTIGELREETLQRIKDLPPGVTKDQYLGMGCAERDQYRDIGRDPRRRRHPHKEGHRGRGNGPAVPSL
jgi:CO dehydrogenase nickel-insertion accessory protein CooC1